VKMGRAIDIILPNIALYAETGQGGAHSTHSVCWLLASMELPGSWCRARGWRRWGDAWLLCCRISHYLRSWDNRETLTPPYLVAASEYGATAELPYSRICSCSQNHTSRQSTPLLTPAPSHPSLLGNKSIAELVDSDDGGVP
jgi:hypothetical protein